MQDLETLQSLLPNLRRAGQRAGLVAFDKEGSRRWSGAEVADMAEQLARGLVELGVQPGEFVPVLAPNRPEWVVAALAILGAGAAVSPLDTQINQDTLERVLQDSDARFIFTATEYLNRLGQLDLEREPRPILLDVEPADERGWRVLLTGAEISLPSVSPDDPAALFYTSGTTGVPKGVPLTHANLVFQLKSVFETKLVREDDRILLPLPMYHVYPFTIGTLVPLAFRVPIILPQSLTGPHLIRALREGDVTIIVGVPRVYRAVYDGLEAQIEARGTIISNLFQAGLNGSIALRRRFGWQLGRILFRPLRAAIGPNLRLLTSGGSALAPELAWRLEGLGWELGIGYGLTETSPMLTMNLPTTQPPKLASVGRPIPGIELRIDPTAHPDEEEPAQANGRPPNEGEILARGTSVFAGYRHLPEETARAFTPDGWFRTGDLGYLDEAGYLYISGRASTLIVLEGGKNIQPEPLEEIYQQNEFIREIGILYQGNQLAALVVPEIEAVNRLRNGDTESAIREAVNERARAVASYQRLTDYAITEEPLARTNLGKLRRHVLAERYNQVKQGRVETEGQQVGPIPIEDMPEQDRALLAQPEARQLWDWLSERYSDKRLTPDTSPQFDLGIDSLEWLTLTLEVRDLTGAELSDEAIQRVSTVRDLLQAVQTAAESESAEATLISADNVAEILTEEQNYWLSPMGPVLNRVADVTLFLFQMLMRLVFRLKAYGIENLPDEENFILTPNHTSNLDALSVAAVLPFRQLRRTAFVAGRDVMLRSAFRRLVSRLAQVLPIDRFTKGTGRQEMALTVAALQQQKNLIWFPEGRLSRTDKMLPFREGIGIVLDRYPTLVVPVYIEGTREALPADTVRLKLEPISVTFGPPVETAILLEEGEGERPSARIARALQARVAALGEDVPVTLDKVDS